MSAETTKLSQKDYLKKYLAGKSDGKKKKKKKVKGSDPVIRAKVKLIDDDVDISKLQPIDESALDLYELNEDAPQVVGIVDERPPELQVLDQYKQGQRWKVIGNLDGDVNVSVSGGAKQSISVSVSDEEEEFNVRPPHRQSDSSPPRRKRHDHSDESPPRRKRHDHSDESPPRRKRQQSSDKSPVRRKRRDDSDASPPRKRAQSDSDASPPRKAKWDDSDASPPRRRQSHKSISAKQRANDSDTSPPRKGRNRDSDESPPRKGQAEKSHGPPRRHDDRRKESYSSKREENDSDTSPPRRRPAREEPEQRSTKVKIKQEKDDNDRHDDKMKKTLDGKVAGLQNAKRLKDELLELKQREDRVFAKMDDSLSGRGAVAVQRDRKTGLKRDFEQEQAEQRAKDEKENKKKEKYSRWGKGLKQTEDQQERLATDLYEMSKPLARYADDADLDSYLRVQDREGDPMLEYLRNKKKEETKSAVPLYKGSFPPNRYNIRPGYRWDGVDRSNGYERKRFEAINAKKAVEEEAYKWSTSDM